MSAQETTAVVPETVPAPVATEISQAPEVKPTEPKEEQPKEEPKEESSNQEEAKAEEAEPKTEQPKPTPSRSATTAKRLSVLLNKAKKSFSNAAEKVTSEDHHSKDKTPAIPAETEEPAEIPVSEVTPAAEQPVATATTTTTEHAAAAAAAPAVETEKSEKRKSKFLNGIFSRSKSPAKETESKPEETGPATAAAETEPVAAEVTEENPTATTETTSPTAEHTETSATGTHKEQPNVIDQIKRHSFVNKLFGKKKEAEKHVSEEHPTTEAAEESAPAPESTPVAEPKSDEPAAVPQEEPVKPTSRPSSPLGRRLTHMFKRNKKEKKDKQEGSASSAEEPHAASAEATDAAAPVPPAKDEQPSTTEETVDVPAAAPATASPAVQATA
ncbi:hypothetical protein DFQ28_010936 [Apophysomyces sp. BC1034]|nr:hypothetical protein DFQ30_010620 [Apophysomyces sp. BC1015]KAG0170097.1 hypothetical protein DFQ29_009433 [Apophysomyces sp. BC1021]KAG0184553.1 hypothetical protein DFQ28_010936 [Apophysomyces sp. BC1034]